MTSIPVWERDTPDSLAVLHGTRDADCCVIGLGGSGLSAIHRLLEMGTTVIGLDAGSVANGAAGRNGGFLLAGLPDFYHDAVARHGRGRVRDIYARTMVEMDRITSEVPEAVRRVGSLRIAADAEELQDCYRQAEMLRADGFECEAYRGPEGDGLLIPGDGAFDPLLRCRILTDRAIARGARLFEQSPAIEIRGDCVRTEHGTVRCQRVIVAVDGRLGDVLPELSTRVRSARLQMLATAPAHDVLFRRPVYRRYGFDYWQQLPSGEVALGGLRDQSGESEWSTDAVPTEPVQRALDGLLRIVVKTAAPVTHRWAGVVGYTDNGFPIAEEVRPRVWAIGGYSGTGNVLGALCARGVAEIAVTGTTDLLDGWARE